MQQVYESLPSVAPAYATVDTACHEQQNSQEWEELPASAAPAVFQHGFCAVQRSKEIVTCHIVCALLAGESSAVRPIVDVRVRLEAATPWLSRLTRSHA